MTVRISWVSEFVCMSFQGPDEPWGVYFKQLGTCSRKWHDSAMCRFCDADSCTRFREENLMAKGQRMSKKQLLLPCGKNTVLMQRCNQVTASSVGKYITYSKSSHSKLSWKVYHILRINQSNSLGKSMLAKSYFKLLDSVPDPLALYLMLAQAWPHAPVPKWRPWERRVSEEVSKPAGAQAFWMGRRGEREKTCWSEEKESNTSLSKWRVRVWRCLSYFWKKWQPGSCI